MAIRALDYAPVTDLLFGDYWSALVTADLEVQPDDSRYGYREKIARSFSAYGIAPASSTHGSGGVEAAWEAPDVALDYSTTHFESMRHNRDEIFRFLWENRRALGLSEEAYTRVQSVRPCTRLSSEGLILRETVAEYVQILNLRAADLKGSHIRMPSGMPQDQSLTLYGGGALIFSEFGQLKYHVRTNVLNPRRKASRLQYLWESGFFESVTQGERRFAEMHRARLMGGREPLNGVHPNAEFF
jgi:hypothetical protein